MTRIILLQVLIIFVCVLISSFPEMGKVSSYSVLYCYNYFCFEGFLFFISLECLLVMVSHFLA